MKSIVKYLVVLLFLSNVIFSQKVDFFNSTLNKNAVSVAFGGETLIYGLGYQRCIRTSIKTRTCFDIKASYLDAFYFPISLYSELFENKNKLLFGCALGNKFNTYFEYKSIKDLKYLLKTNIPLYRHASFLYVPYASVKTGYKRYFSNRQSFSIESMLIAYPYFKEVKGNPAISKLGLKYQPYVCLNFYILIK